MITSHEGTPKRLPENPSVENLKKQAKQLLKAKPSLSLQQAQHQLAKSYGCKKWDDLLSQVAALQAANRSSSEAISPPTAGQAHLRHEASRHWIEGIAPLGWNKSGQSTVIASLGAALSVLAPDSPRVTTPRERTIEALPAQTGPAWDYNTLMGDSAIAFRVRWHRRGGFRQTSSKPATWWAFTMAYAGGPEEEALLQRAIGWQFDGTPYHYPNNATPLEQLPKIQTSVDKGLPVVACLPEEFGVIQGYDSDSNEVLVTAYHQGAQIWIPATEIGTKVLFLASPHSSIPRDEAMTSALESAVSNWSRGEVPAPEAGSTWEDEAIRIQYGAAAYEEWANDLKHADMVPERARRQLRDASAFNMSTLSDARWAAAGYLREARNVLPESCFASLTAAADIYEDLARQTTELFAEGKEFFGTWRGQELDEWSPALRENEAALLERYAQLEGAAVAEIRNVIAKK